MIYVEEALANAIGALFSLIAIGWVFGLIVLCLVVALITWIVKSVWYAGENRERKQREKRYKQQQKQWKKYQKEWAKIDRQKALEEEYQRKHAEKKGFEYNPDWKWDEESQLWRHRSTWDK